MSVFPSGMHGIEFWNFQVWLMALRGSIHGLFRRLKVKLRASRTKSKIHSHKLSLLLRPGRQIGWK